MIAHIGALPLEELLPVLTGAGSGLLGGARVDNAPRATPPGRLNHNAPRDVGLTREVARGWDTGAGHERSIANRLAQLVLDLRAQHPRPVPGHRDQDVDRLTGLVRRAKRGSRK